VGPLGGGGGGVATAAGDGTTTITAKFDGLSGTAVLTVTDPPILFVQVTPTNPNIPVQGAVQFTATAVFTDNSTRNVTGQATWSASDSPSPWWQTQALPSAAPLDSGPARPPSRRPTAERRIVAADRGPECTIDRSHADQPHHGARDPGALQRDGNAFEQCDLGCYGRFVLGFLGFNRCHRERGGGCSSEKAGTTTITATYLGVSGSSTLTSARQRCRRSASRPTPSPWPTGAALQLTATGTYSDSSRTISPAWPPGCRQPQAPPAFQRETDRVACSPRPAAARPQ